MIPANMCGVDRSLRAALGVALIALGVLVPTISQATFLSAVVIGFGLLNLFSAVMSFSPVYRVAGLSTVRESENNSTS